MNKSKQSDQHQQYQNQQQNQDSEQALMNGKNHPSSQSNDKKKIIANSIGNMSLVESNDGSYFNNYDSTRNVNHSETDNIPVEARPKSAG